MELMLIVESVLGAGMSENAEASYLLRVDAALERCGVDIPTMREAAEAAAGAARGRARGLPRTLRRPRFRQGPRRPLD